MFRHEPHRPQIKALTEMFKKAVKVAVNYEIKMAIENYIDFTADEILQKSKMLNRITLGLNLTMAISFAYLMIRSLIWKKFVRYTFATNV